MRSALTFAAALVGLLSSTIGPAAAEEAFTASLSIRNRAFEPRELEVPANRKIELHIRNADASAAEFESHELHREKVVAPGRDVTVSIGPLRSGRYEFFDDLNPQARGHIIAR
jgi:hypothetical protein